MRSISKHHPICAVANQRGQNCEPGCKQSNDSAPWKRVFSNSSIQKTDSKNSDVNQESSSHSKCPFCAEKSFNRNVQSSPSAEYRQSLSSTRSASTVASDTIIQCCIDQQTLRTRVLLGMDAVNGENPEKERTPTNQNTSTAPASPKPGTSKQVYHCQEEKDIGTLLKPELPGPVREAIAVRHPEGRGPTSRDAARFC